MLNTSPWIEQLQKKRPLQKLAENKSTEVTIVGAGIAGVCTAYFTLQNTDKNVVLIEAGKVAHGATGHNAGQMISYFEQQIAGLVKEYGLELTADAQNAIDSAWDLLDDIFAESQITTPSEQFTGYAGCQDLEEVLVHLENIVFCQQARIRVEPLILAEDVGLLEKIPPKYKGLYTTLPQEEILKLLETEDTRFIALLSARKGCMNSALFCEDVLEYLLATFADRCIVLENSPVSDVQLFENFAVLKVLDFEIKTEKVVLCTNGFERFSITNKVGADINKNFHHLVRGSVGYMAAYLEEAGNTPIAISYLPPRSKPNASAFESEPYIYFTRRPFEGEANQKHSLICIGGPESLMDDTNNYQKEHPYPEEAQQMIDDFLHKTYKHAPKGDVPYKYKWHGLMGYTPNGVRCIGPEPLNPVLLYNLGCNGTGILSSIYGASKTSHFLNGIQMKKSIFDPQDYRQHDVAVTTAKSDSIANKVRKCFRGN